MKRALGWGKKQARLWFKQGWSPVVPVAQTERGGPKTAPRSRFAPILHRSGDLKRGQDGYQRA